MCCHWPPLSSLKGSKWFFKCNAKHIMARYRMNLCDVHPHANTRLLLPFRSNCLYRKRDVHKEHIACYYMMYLKTTSGCSSHVLFNLSNLLYLEYQRNFIRFNWHYVFNPISIWSTFDIPSVFIEEQKAGVKKLISTSDALCSVKVS